VTTDETNESNRSDRYRQEAAELFQRAMKANPSNVNNMLWYAKFLHKTNQIIQVTSLYSLPSP
jgi:hypothetical protein